MSVFYHQFPSPGQVAPPRPPKTLPGNGKVLNNAGKSIESLEYPWWKIKPEFGKSEKK